MNYYKNYNQNFERNVPTPAYPNYNMQCTSSQQAMLPKDPRLNCYQYPTFNNSQPVKTDDDLWVETWLAKNGIISINLDSSVLMVRPKANKSRRKSSISINTAKDYLKKSLQALMKLQTIHQDLSANVDKMSSIEWTQKTQEIGELKEQISRMIYPFEIPEGMAMIKQLVEKRRKKRSAQKRRKEIKKSELNEMHRKRREIEKGIDEWLHNKKEEVEQAKMEENMKKDADCILSEVTRKKAEARKTMSLISALVKLRKAREQAAVQRGEKMSASDRVAFEKVTGQLEQIWTNLSAVYTKEEQGLRLMLEQNASEDSAAAVIAKEQKTAAEWDYILFGPKCISNSAYWALTSAMKSMETFTAVRRSWDTFLTNADDPNGSKMPIGWVLPVEEAEEPWKKYLNTS